MLTLLTSSEALLNRFGGQLKAYNIYLILDESISSDFRFEKGKDIFWLTEAKMLRPIEEILRLIPPRPSGNKSKSNRLALLTRSMVTSGSFVELQCALMAVDVSVLPVADENDVVAVLSKMASTTHSSGCIGRSSPPGNEALVMACRTIGGMGEVKAVAALNEFKSLRKIAAETEEGIKARVPAVARTKLPSFFHEPINY